MLASFGLQKPGPLMTEMNGPVRLSSTTSRFMISVRSASGRCCACRSRSDTTRSMAPARSPSAARDGHAERAALDPSATDLECVPWPQIIRSNMLEQGQHALGTVKRPCGKASLVGLVELPHPLILLPGTEIAVSAFESSRLDSQHVPHNAG